VLKLTHIFSHKKSQLYADFNNTILAIQPAPSANNTIDTYMIV